MYVGFHIYERAESVDSRLVNSCKQFWETNLLAKRLQILAVPVRFWPILVMEHDIVLQAMHVGGGTHHLRRGRPPLDSRVAFWLDL